MSGDYTFAGPRYRVTAYAYIAAAQFGSLRSSAVADSQIAEDKGIAAAAQPAAVDPPALARTYVHLGSLRSAASAKEEWSRLQQAFPAQLANLDLILERVQLEPEGVFYRVLANTAESLLSPRQLCTALRQNNQYCSLIKPGAT